jgi:adenosine kinase
VCPDAMVKVAKYASENGKYFAFNLSAPFLCQFFKDPMLQVLPYANLVIKSFFQAEIR